MAAKKTFSELAKALPDRERRQLLERIVRALSLDDQEQRSVYHGSIQADARQRIVSRELERLSLWDRFLFWIKRIGSTKKEEEAFCEFKLDRIRRRLSTGSINYVRFDRRTVEPAVAETVIDLYRASVELAPFFRSIWEDADRLQWMITALLERRVPNARTEVRDFATIDEMQAIFAEHGSKAAIRSAIQERTDDYLASIPPELFRDLEEGIIPLYLLKYVCLFPYREFLGLFRVTAEALDGEPEPEFDAAPAATALEFLEQLYFALYAACRLEGGVRIHPELLEAYDSYEKEPQGTSAKRYNTLLDNLVETARNVDTALPLADVIRYFRDDPYYKLMVYLPKLKLRDFYVSQLRVRVFAQIDEVFPEIRLGIVQRISSEIFPDDPPSLDFYRHSLVVAGRKLDAPPFRYFRCLRTIRYFVRSIYRDQIAPTVRLLARIMPVRYRDTASELTLRANGIEDIGERVSMFDYTFSPDSDEGKAFFRLRYAGERDIAQARTYGTVVAQKNREARDIVEDAVESFQGLESVFRGLISLGSRTVVERYEALTNTNRGPELEQLLRRNAETIAKVRNMLHQLVEIE